jgi:hypothetical protein
LLHERRAIDCSNRDAQCRTRWLAKFISLLACATHRVLHRLAGSNDPGVTIAFDSNAAAATRKKVFGELASHGVLLGADHLQFPALGHLRTGGTSWRSVPLNYSTQLR